MLFLKIKRKYADQQMERTDHKGKTLTKEGHDLYIFISLNVCPIKSQYDIVVKASV